MFRKSSKISGWAFLPIGLSGLLGALLIGRESLFPPGSVNSSEAQAGGAAHAEQSAPPPASSSASTSGIRYQLTYEQWVALLEQEARVVSEQRPERLKVLAGDSISLWFPVELLPESTTWLNQGISGETSYGLLRRLRLFDTTQPEVVFVMIGINDLLRGVSEETLLANHREILRHLRKAHPRARIVLQSILPHAGSRVIRQPAIDRSAWSSRIVADSNARIQKLNRKLATIARDEKAEFLDLYPSFADAAGDLRTELTTDGLHLNREGYQVWKSQIQAFLSSGRKK